MPPPDDQVPGTPDLTVAAIYRELHGIARHLLSGERDGHTLQPTALLNEAWLRLRGVDATWCDRDHFVRAAAGSMRRVLVDHARARGRDKRGGGALRVTLAPELLGAEARVDDLVAVDEALQQLASVDPQLVDLVELRVFGELTHAEIARTLGTSLRSVERGWRLARAFLVRALGGA